MKTKLIAPCGMNCNICKGHLRDKNKCPGCGKANMDYRRRCTIANCDYVKKKGSCIGCEILPCKRMKSLDKRYRAKYNMSMLENLAFIKKKGVKKFLEKEREKWKCPDCGGVVSCHDNQCYDCGKRISL